MEVKAVYKYARISAKKMRDVAQEIQGLSVSQATDILSYTPKKGAYLLNKTLKSALANAENNAELSVDTLVVKSVMDDDGPTCTASVHPISPLSWPIKKARPYQSNTHIAELISWVRK